MKPTEPLTRREREALEAQKAKTVKRSRELKELLAQIGPRHREIVTERVKHRWAAEDEAEARTKRSNRMGAPDLDRRDKGQEIGGGILPLPPRDAPGIDDV